MLSAARTPVTEPVDLARRVADVADQYGDAETAGVLRREAQLAAVPGCTVVVVGEKNRGKTSLINALLGRPGLLPVDADVATNVHIEIGYGEQDTAAAFDPAHPDGFEIAIAQVAEYAALDFDADERVSLHPDVERVVVGVNAPLLRDGLVLLDTPGVGGLVAGHTAITLATLERADALVFVVNGSVELRASELAFLEKATSRIATVMFVLTGTDRYPGWRSVLTRNIDLLRQHAPRFAAARWFPVSNRFKNDADRAATVGDADLAAELLAKSGFPPLLAEVTDNLAGRIATDRLRVLLNLTGSTLDRLDDAEQQRLQSLSGDPALAATIKAHRAELDALADTDAQWRANLHDRFAVLRSRLERRAFDGLAGLRTAAETRIAAGGRDAATEVPRGIRDGARAIVMDLENTLHTDAVAIVASLADDFGVHGLAVLGAELPPGIGIDNLPRFRAADPSRGGMSTPEGSGPVDPADPTGLVPWPTPPADSPDIADPAGPVSWPVPTPNLPALRDGGQNLPIPREQPRGLDRQALLAALRRGGDTYRRMPAQQRTNVAWAGVAAVAVVAVGAFAIFKGIGAQRNREALRAYADEAISQLQHDLPAAVRDSVEQLRTDLERRATDRLRRRAAELERVLAQAEADEQAAAVDLAPRRADAQARRERIAALRAETTDLHHRLAGEGR